MFIKINFEMIIVKKIFWDGSINVIRVHPLEENSGTIKSYVTVLTHIFFFLEKKWQKRIHINIHSGKKRIGIM